MRNDKNRARVRTSMPDCRPCAPFCGPNGAGVGYGCHIGGPGSQIGSHGLACGSEWLAGSAQWAIAASRVGMSRIVLTAAVNGGHYGQACTTGAPPNGQGHARGHAEHPHAASARGQAGYSASRHTSQALQLQQPGHWQSPGPQSQQSNRCSHATRHDSRNSHMADPIRDDEHGIVTADQSHDSARDMHSDITGYAASAAHAVTSSQKAMASAIVVARQYVVTPAASFHVSTM